LIEVPFRHTNSVRSAPRITGPSGRAATSAATASRVPAHGASPKRLQRSRATAGNFFRFLAPCERTKSRPAPGFLHAASLLVSEMKMATCLGALQSDCQASGFLGARPSSTVPSARFFGVASKNAINDLTFYLDAGIGIDQGSPHERHVEGPNRNHSRQFGFRRGVHDAHAVVKTIR
jgi:hypothetical protein